MKKLRLIIPVLLICLFLSGCGFFLPFFYLNFPGPAQQEVVVELPIGTDVDPQLSADDIYWRSKFAASGRAMQYSENATVELTFTDDTDYWTDLHYDTNVTLDPDNSAVNVQTLISFDYDEPSVFWDYYRDEDGRLIYYFYDETADDCSREEIPLDDQTPYAIILDFSVYGYPYDPVELSIDPQTRILNDREVYVLTYQQSALNIFGYTGNSVWDKELGKRYIPATWYVDAETYLPVRQEYTLIQIDDILGQLISSIYSVDVYELDVAITGFTLSIDYTSFDPVELPAIPDDVLRKAWDNAGFSVN